VIVNKFEKPEEIKALFLKAWLFALASCKRLLRPVCEAEDPGGTLAPFLPEALKNKVCGMGEG